jgi:hypothetical protein
VSHAAAGLTPPPALPLSFREEIVPHVFAALRGGASVAIVGLPGGGVSNALRFLAEPRVAAHYLKSEAPATLLALVEADRWLSPEHVFAELARAVLEAARAAGWPRAEQAALRARVEAAHAAALPMSATPLAELLEHLCGGLGRRVVFVGDEFDEALARLPAPLLRELRALRDAHKYRLAFVLGLRQEPGRLLAARPTGAEGPGAAKFGELFDAHTYPLRPYAPADSRVALARKTVGWAPPLAPEEAEALHTLSGGHAKLLMTALVYLASHRGQDRLALARGLAADPGVGEACRALWEALPRAEQWALWRLAQDGPARDQLADDDLARLRVRGLAAGGPPFVFSSLLEAFLQARPEPAEPASAAGPPARLRDPNAAPPW